MDEVSQPLPPPVPSRPLFPAGYGVPTDDASLLTWQEVAARLAAAPTYWLVTATADGLPHVMPVDGLWLGHRLFFGGDPQTRWSRNLAANPRAVVHLESARDLVVVRGRVVRVATAAPALREDLAAASRAKYGAGTAPPWWVLVPQVAFAWTNLAVDPTRWHFDDGSRRLTDR
jgi:hypothetical protein